MDSYKRAKLNKILIIIAAILVLVAIICIVVYSIVAGKKQDDELDFRDTIIGKNYYVDITIDTETKKVKRDQIDTSLQEEFGISDQKAEELLNTTGDLINYFENSTNEVEMRNKVIHIKNPFQTKTLLVEADEIEDNFDAIKETQVQEGLYILEYDTQKRTKKAYQYLQERPEIKKVQVDEVDIINTINDESQTVYGEKDEKNNLKDYGATAMGLEKYKRIVKENGNPAQITIATIGYGANIQNEYFNGKISEEYYNFIADEENAKDVHETIAQGSRILEVIHESTTDNIKILPLVVINDEYYTTTSSIIRAINYATEKSDIICYEFTHKQDYMIELALQKSFKENVPVCCVTKMVEENEEIFPANNSTTIAVSSVDKDLKTTSYSGSGEYIDFVASSTDVQEIFNTSSTVSKWSGAGYSNAHIASLIALIKTYNKQATILEIYNVLRNYCRDLGSQGRDETYGYGFPDFNEIKISDIDKVLPEIKEVVIDEVKWEKSKSINIKGSDNIRIYGWNVTKSKEIPKDWKKLEIITNNLDVKDEIKDNGTYYIWVTDSAGNISYLNKEITKIDTIPPIIQYSIDDSKKDTEKYITIKVNGKDNESGLHQMAYSWDKQSWGTENNILNVTKNGTYTIYVRDALENISEKKITIKSFPQEGIANLDEGNVIKEVKVSSNWDNNINKEVIITLQDNLDIETWKITESDIAPQEFEDQEDGNLINQNQNTQQNQNIQQNQNSQGFTNVTITASLEKDKKYYVWVKLRNRTVNSQGFTIKKPE